MPLGWPPRCRDHGDPCAHATQLELPAGLRGTCALVPALPEEQQSRRAQWPPSSHPTPPGVSLRCRVYCAPIAESSPDTCMEPEPALLPAPVPLGLRPSWLVWALAGPDRHVLRDAFPDLSPQSGPLCVTHPMAGACALQEPSPRWGYLFSRCGQRVGTPQGKGHICPISHCLPVRGAQSSNSCWVDGWVIEGWWMDGGCMGW